MFKLETAQSQKPTQKHIHYKKIPITELPQQKGADPHQPQPFVNDEGVLIVSCCMETEYIHKAEAVVSGHPEREVSQRGSGRVR